MVRAELCGGGVVLFVVSWHLWWHDVGWILVFFLNHQQVINNQLPSETYQNGNYLWFISDTSIHLTCTSPPNPPFRLRLASLTPKVPAPCHPSLDNLPGRRFLQVRQSGVLFCWQRIREFANNELLQDSTQLFDSMKLRAMGLKNRQICLGLDAMTMIHMDSVLRHTSGLWQKKIP